MEFALSTVKAERDEEVEAILSVYPLTDPGFQSDLDELERRENWAVEQIYRQVEGWIANLALDAQRPAMEEQIRQSARKLKRPDKLDRTRRKAGK